MDGRRRKESEKKGTLKNYYNMKKSKAGVEDDWQDLQVDEDAPSSPTYKHLQVEEEISTLNQFFETHEAQNSRRQSKESSTAESHRRQSKESRRSSKDNWTVEIQLDDLCSSSKFRSSHIDGNGLDEERSRSHGNTPRPQSKRASLPGPLTKGDDGGTPPRTATWPAAQGGAKERLHKRVTQKELSEADFPEPIEQVPPMFPCQRSGGSKETHYSYFQQKIPSENPVCRRAMAWKSLVDRRSLFGRTSGRERAHTDPELDSTIGSNSSYTSPQAWPHPRAQTFTRILPSLPGNRQVTARTTGNSYLPA